jgi:hypothetical protein
MNVVRTKKFQEPIQLADAHPVDQIHMLLQRWIGLTRECDSNYLFNASFPR